MAIALASVAVVLLTGAPLYIALLIWGAVEDGRDQRSRDRLRRRR